MIRHAAFYADLSARAAENSYGPDQIVWARQIKLERDNIRAALANAIDTGNATLAVQLVANHPFQYKAEGPTGEVFVDAGVTRTATCREHAQEPGYPRVCWWQA